MKNLLFYSSRTAQILLFALFFWSCCTNHASSGSNANPKKTGIDTTSKNLPTKGEATGSVQTNRGTSSSDSNPKKVVIRNDAPNQAKIDSIKRIKTKGKK
jgi:ABC-type enterochelin transport system substrate-binding protein